MVLSTSSSSVDDAQQSQDTVTANDNQAIPAKPVGFTDWMLKEIFDQPQVLREVLAGRYDADAQQLAFPELASLNQQLHGIQHVYIVACGTSSHAGLIGKGLIESLTNLTVDVQIASEFKFQRPAGKNDALVIAISQSGQTSDTMSAVRQAKANGASIIAITNVLDSDIARAADATLYIRADVELAVPATKSYTAQLLVLSQLAVFLAQQQGALSAAEVASYHDQLAELPALIEQVLKLDNIARIEAAAASCEQAKNLLLIGRGYGVATCYEGALKLKETSYLHAEAFPALEFQHGPIALIDPDQATPLVALLPLNSPDDPIYAVIQKSRQYGARLLALAADNDKRVGELANQTLWLGQPSELQQPFVAVVTLQLFAHALAQLLGRDIDNPRYLSKAVISE
ncbi:MAG: SIS domain-containing protein [Coriobacteriales bacterium]|nr:SIS domain-containing protein [Coriobacteriales bacterium]